MQKKHIYIKVFSGKDEPNSFSFACPCEIVFGRDKSCNVRVVDKKISRKHTKIYSDGIKIFAEDLKSTNGTYIDGTKIEKSEVDTKNKIQIGTSIIYVSLNEDELEEVKTIPSIKKDKHTGPIDGATMVDRMAGELSKLPIADLISLLNKNKATGELEIKFKDNKKGKVYISNGDITFVNYDNVYLGKALFRIMQQASGTFLFLPKETPRFDIEITEETVDLIVKIKKEITEFEALQKESPIPEKLKLNSKLSEPISKLRPEVLDVIQSVINFGKAHDALNKSPLDDLETYHVLLFLIRHGYVVEG